MSLRYPLLAAGVLFTCAVSFSRADDWPSFRGPNGDGISKETGLLKEWPKDGPPKVWTAKNLGSGFGTPSIAEGKIFGMGTRGGKDGVWALKESDGSELWFTEIEDGRARNPNTGPSGTPAFSAGKVYAVTTGGKVVCLDTATGKKVWGADFLKDFAGQVPQWGYTETPLVDGDKVVVAPGSSTALVVALNKDTGKVLWQTELKGGGGSGTGYSTPVKATVGGIPMYVVLTGKTGGVVGVHADTGKLLWQYNAVGFGGTAQIAMPIVKDNLVWFSTAYGGGAGLLELAAEGKDKVTAKPVKVHRGTLQNHHGGMVLVGDHLYFGNGQNNGQLVCVEFKTGEVKWGPERAPAGDKSRSASILYADGRLYVRYEATHDIYLVDPSPEGLKVISSFKEPDQSGKQSWAHPVIANGKLYIRDQDKLHCFNVKADRN
jgi:outer membrane protein assembly factor BamB